MEPDPWKGLIGLDMSSLLTPDSPPPASTPNDGITSMCHHDQLNRFSVNSLNNKKVIDTWLNAPH